MPITFHCEYCGKKIEAQDSTAGKWGRCPACHNKIYVPNLNPDEELKLAPIDESEEERKKRLMAETYRLEQAILTEREIPDEPTKADTPTHKISDKKLMKNIILYLRQMADGKLEQAQRTADMIAPFGTQAIKILDGIALSEIPEPELAGIPPQVLSGLIRNLRSKIG
jgi:cytochrome c1